MFDFNTVLQPLFQLLLSFFTGIFDLFSKAFLPLMVVAAVLGGGCIANETTNGGIRKRTLTIGSPLQISWEDSTDKPFHTRSELNVGNPLAVGGEPGE